MSERRPSLLREFLRSRRLDSGPPLQLFVELDEAESGSQSALAGRPWRELMEWSGRT